MDEVLRSHGDEIREIAKEVGAEAGVIRYVGDMMFSDKFTNHRIAFFLAFAEKVNETYPFKKQEVYEEVFKSIYRNIQF
jgi:hypothetical protein